MSFLSKTQFMQAREVGWELIRSDFPILEQTVHGNPLVYFDSAATSQKPRAVLEALQIYYTQNNANVHRGIHELSNRATAAFEAGRARVARFLNAASADEIVFTRGTTEGINLVASTWGAANLKAGDKILLTEMEHHSNIVPWQMLAEKVGAHIDVCPLTDAGLIDLDWLEANLTEQHKLVALAHVSNVLGSILGAKRAAKAAHAVGAKLLLDGCQAAPRMRLNMAELGCDFYVFSGHKLYGPTGVGVLWASAETLDAMSPWQGGGAMIDRVTFEKTTYAPAPSRFEAGTPMIIEVIGLHAAIDYVDTIGPEAIFAHESALAAQTREALRSVNSITLYGPEKSAGIVSFSMEGVHPHDIGTILDEEGVAIRAGHHCCQPLMDHLGVPATARASFGIYSDENDVAALVRGLERVKRIFG
jgi:cysteine desulfurase / selenocysteine lyase